MTSKILNPREYVLSSIVEYPSLYAAGTYDESAFKVYDQLFNVIGNGVRNTYELIREVTGTPVSEESAQKYLNNEPLYYGYENVLILNSGFKYPDPSKHEDFITVIESEKDKHPNIKLWVDCSLGNDDENNITSPYPNFSEKYSIVYNSDFTQLGNEWQEAAIWYYQKAKDFFEQTPSYYRRAYPSNDSYEDKELISGYLEEFKNKSPQQITEQYNTEYNEDVYKFAEAHWQNKLSQIKIFLAKTIEMLENNLEPIQKNKNKP